MSEKLAVTDAPEDEMQTRLRDLQREISEAKVDWYIVPSEDEHQSEEIGESEKRREYISGFTGTAGAALIPASTSSNALLFVDPRYWVQAERQVPTTGWEVKRMGSRGSSGSTAVMGGWMDWVVSGAKEGYRIGIDPKLISLSLVRSLQSRLANTPTKLIPLADNLVDTIHAPAPRSTGPINPYPLTLSGEDTKSKLVRVRKAITDQTSSASWIYILPTLPAIAWLLNYRCPSDIPFCPVAYAYLALTPCECVMFVDERKVQSEELRKCWKEDGIEVRPYGVDEIGKFVKESKQEKAEKEDIRVYAPRECSWALSDACDPLPIDIIDCPVDKIKAVKNLVEQQNFRNAYLRDGRAMVRWMAWLEGKILKEQRPVGEWAAAQTLTRFRRTEDMFAGLAYDDISGSGPNAALPHYAPKRGQDRLIDPDATYVIDSGAQYLDATIDTTRTLYFGKSPSDEIKRAYTRVLQGHMAVSASTFPLEVDADRFAMLARAPLYNDGLDFGHGVGHGVGSYLAVHESPMFSRGTSFEPGHVTTIEPGFYKEGEFGVRIESVLLCKKIATKYGYGGDQWLGWVRITQVPIQASLVDWSIMTKDDIRWLNDHNNSVREALWPLLQEDQDGEARDWLKRMTKAKKIWPWTGA